MSAQAVEIRRIVTTLDDIYHEGGPRRENPIRRGTIAAVITNPFAGTYVEDIAGFMEPLTPLGISLAQRLLTAMNASSEDIQTYGKGAIVGVDGELEHGALWHVPGGYAMRELLGWRDSQESDNGQQGNALAIVPSTKKVGAAGASLDVPLTHINASYVRGHFDAIEVRVPDSPRANELVLILAMGTGPRVHARVGGLTADKISKWDGLR